MKRIPETELMLEKNQVIAYSEADFSAPHDLFVNIFDQRFPNWNKRGKVLDIGCGSCDVVSRFAKKFPECTIDAVDGSEPMLEYGQRMIDRDKLSNRVTLVHDLLPCPTLKSKRYDAVITNSLLHHLKNPFDLWETVKHAAKPESPVLIMDLMRPDSKETARSMVETYAADEAEILKHDFYHSLLAAYRIEEVREQLNVAGLPGFDVERVSDRHMIIYGRR